MKIPTTEKHPWKKNNFCQGVEIVTPSKARQMLDFNTFNRIEKNNNIGNITDCIESGK